MVRCVYLRIELLVHKKKKVGNENKQGKRHFLFSALCCHFKYTKCNGWGKWQSYRIL